MIYVLAHPCEHKDHEGECGELAYLLEDPEIPVFKQFISRCDAEKYIETNNWNPEHIMIIPQKEVIK